MILPHWWRMFFCMKKENKGETILLFWTIFRFTWLKTKLATKSTCSSLFLECSVSCELKSQQPLLNSGHLSRFLEDVSIFFLFSSLLIMIAVDLQQTILKIKYYCQIWTSVNSWNIWGKVTMIQTISPVFIISEFDCTNYRQDTKEKKKKRTKMTIKNNEIEKKNEFKRFWTERAN